MSVIEETTHIRHDRHRFLYFFLWFLILGSFTVALWTVAIYFFIALEVTDKTLQPWESRDLNRDCFLGIFDHHDVWHILGSLGLGAICFLLLIIPDKEVNPLKMIERALEKEEEKERKAELLKVNDRDTSDKEEDGEEREMTSM